MGSKKKKKGSYHKFLHKLKSEPIFASYAKKINKKIKQNYHNKIKKLYDRQKKTYPNHILPKFNHDLYPNKPMVSLGCLSSLVAINDIVPINIKTDIYDKWGNVSTQGSQNSPFQSNVILTTNTEIYNVSAIANHYSSVTLSNEGLLWTLWSLVHDPKKYVESYFKSTYFNNITMGTAKHSNYPLGQMGFFYTNLNLSYTPMDVSMNNSKMVGTKPGQPGLKDTSPSIITGIQGLENTLIQMRVGFQQVGIVVIKVSEEIARVFNPIAGEKSQERYIYLGYDGWCVFNLSTNPIGPMMAKTYLTPQTVTGSVVNKNYQVIVPPNFPNTIYYKNKEYSSPISANNFIGA